MTKRVRLCSLSAVDAASRVRAVSSATWVMWLCLCNAMPLAAQQAGSPYIPRGVTSPGAIGSWRLMQGGPLPGYFQPVEIKAPPGAMVSLAVDGAFDEPQLAPVTVGLLIAPVYHLKVTGIPFQEGFELYPTIEVIDRLYPPARQEARFPIEVELTQEDMELALKGNFVTRVIYLENPDHALPISTTGTHQDWFDAGTGQDPVQVASTFGRPVAILRMGGRLPTTGAGIEDDFLGQCPPLIRYHKPRVPIPIQTVPAAAVTRRGTREGRLR